ncbi:MAG TPA: outer membrane protein assembly factor BamA [Verrucomicrobia bacterium]|nr:outer membrane protein assembly factor BamA [Verrucomicrobiota bacterium]
MKTSNDKAVAMHHGRGLVGRVGLGIIALILTLVAPSAMAANIADIEIEQRGMGRTDKDYIKAHLQASVGAEFSASLAAQDVKRLLETGQFTTVNVRVEEGAGGDVKVIFTVQPKWRLAARPEFQGVHRFRQGKVRKLMELEDGDLVDEQAAGVAMRKVIQEYRKKRYPRATGTWTFETVNEARGLVRLVFVFEEGKPSFVNEIEVKGNQTIPNRELRDALKRPWVLNPWYWIVRKKYDLFELGEIESNVKRQYMNQGFMDVQVSVSSDSEEGGRRAVVKVQEGERYQFGDVRLVGNTLYPDEALRNQLTMQPGTLASLDAIENSAERLQLYYGDRGYLNAGARPVLVPDSQTRKVHVTYNIREGELVNIRNIIIRNNTRTKDKVIRRELLVYPGEVYNQTRVQRSERRLSNLGFFETVRVIPEQTSRLAERDLVFDVTEKRTGQFMIGAGFSSVDNLLGFIELSQGNFDLLGWPYFTGGGQKLRLKMQMSSSRADYELNFTEPWFLDRQLSLGFDLYRRERDYTEYDLKRTGSAIRLGRALPFASRITMQYEIEKNEISDISDLNTYYLLDTYDFETHTGTPFQFTSEEDGVKSAVTLTLAQDTRDNPFIPTRGNRFSTSYSVAGGPMGFDYDFYSVGLQTASYVPLWFGHVLSLRTRFDFAEPFGEADEVPLTERFFLGGGRTLRGFKYRDVGPKVIRQVEGSDRYYDRPYGGQSMFMANAEYTIPIIKMLRFGLFYDTGNVWSEQYTVDFNDLASSTGMGLRLDIPGFPIRIDRAWVLEKDDEFTGEDNWVIWIGYDY